MTELKDFDPDQDVAYAIIGKFIAEFARASVDFFWESTISTTTSGSCDRRKNLLEWIRLEWPNPI